MKRFMRQIPADQTVLMDCPPEWSNGPKEELNCNHTTTASKY